MAKTFDKDNEMQASIAAHKIFGEDGFGPDGGLDPVIYQGNEGKLHHYLSSDVTNPF